MPGRSPKETAQHAALGQTAEPLREMVTSWWPLRGPAPDGRQPLQRSQAPHSAGKYSDPQNTSGPVHGPTPVAVTTLGTPFLVRTGASVTRWPARSSLPLLTTPLALCESRGVVSLKVRWPPSSGRSRDRRTSEGNHTAEVLDGAGNALPHEQPELLAGLLQEGLLARPDVRA